MKRSQAVKLIQYRLKQLAITSISPEEVLDIAETIGMLPPVVIESTDRNDLGKIKWEKEVKDSWD